ncbi:MAG: proprotein convertase P-domain-containing protein, partial [Gemmataceae bacterium]
TSTAPQSIPDGVIDPVTGQLKTLLAKISLPALPAGQVVGDVVVDVNIAHAFTKDLKLELVSPAGDVVLLSNKLGGAGDNYTNTRFDENAQVSIAASGAPFRGTFRPLGLLSNFAGAQAAGDWTLRITDQVPFNSATQANFAGTLQSWGITVIPGELRDGLNPAKGSFIDQNANSRSLELSTTFSTSNDAYAIPNPRGSQPFALPYNTNTLPLSIPGPTVVTSTASQGNLVLNGTSNRVRIAFDRSMNASTFTAADIERITGPVGLVYDATNPAKFPVSLVNVVAVSKTEFDIFFPEQSLSGTYSIRLGSQINSLVEGAALDTNQNAGRDILFGDDPQSELLTTTTYNAVGPAVVPYRGTAALDIEVPDEFVIRQNQATTIELTLNLTTTVVSDLTARLIAPDGTSVFLFSGIGGSGGVPGPNTVLVLNDSAVSPIQRAVAPFVNNPYTPQLPLSAILGKGAKGKWRLEISNAGANPASVTNAVINSWSLRLPKATPNNGQGETIADGTSINFRIFTQDPTNDQTRQVWTPVGPAVMNNGDNSGPATALAVDTSDPSGNTVYVGGSSGGVWKTTNFLTNDPLGPTWIPLTDFGPTSSLNVSSIALFPRNNDPNQTIVFALTGDPNRQTLPTSAAMADGQGVGVLRSLDGGRTWRVLDSTINSIGSQILPIDSNARDRRFFDSRGYKIIVDPKLNPAGEVIVYMAIGGSTTGANGVWRSNDTGRTWALMQGTPSDATDVLLSAGSAGANGNLETLFAGARGQGIFTTSQATSVTTMTLLATLQGNQLVRDVTNPANPSGAEVLVSAPPTS